ncbi:5299_t:CDS:2 [Acaulospora morrowiae]|uniref:5299_t:CDS:1 n=1 Tax=Acaulospora morrowiae TaxID=94023 RepID=A0A9N9D5C5_9GLOM|nr:5299_t:CDS:2 [Acaulospora morrowiae]
MYKINLSLLWFFITIIGFISKQIIALDCRDYTDPLSYKSTKVKCDIVKNEDYDKITANSTEFLSPSEAFVIDFTCGSSDTTLCEKAKNAFISAGQRIASVIRFNTPIRVNASFAALSANTLGSAKPARTIPLQDQDGIIRLYPQALVKQMQFPSHPEFSTYDITALFSSTADVFFKEDVTIQTNQYDFEYIVTHEYIHGLGFISYWREWFVPDFPDLTPYPEFLVDNTDPSKPITYTGFTETAFDRYMVLNTTDKIKMTTLAQQINKFAPIGKKFPSLISFEESFLDSRQSYIAENLSYAAINPYSMDFVTNDSTPVILETKIIPFNPGSSVTHVDTLYMNTSDFLMVYVAQPGITLDDIIIKNGNASGGAIGPYLTKVLETLGYTTANNLSPYRPTLPKSGSNNISPSLSMAISLIITITLSQYFNIF